MKDAASRIVDRLTGLVVPHGVSLEHYQPTIGTEVTGLDLREEVTPEVASFLRALWLVRKVIFFRDQRLSPEQHIRLGRHFGELDVVPSASGTTDARYPELRVLSRYGDDRTQNEAIFHMDLPYADPPAAGAVALLRACPDTGGDTIFADMEAAYSKMSDWLKRAVEGLETEIRFDDGVRYYNPDMKQDVIDSMMAKYPPAIFPLVRTHPETGRKILYASLPGVSRIIGIPRDENYALLKLLTDQARVPEHQCRFRWRENSIAVWDNRSTQHYACFDYAGQHRELHRVTIMSPHRWPR